MMLGQEIHYILYHRCTAIAVQAIRCRSRYAVTGLPVRAYQAAALQPPNSQATFGGCYLRGAFSR